MPQETKPSRPVDPAGLVLGYLNFSSGAFDPAVWRAMSELFAAVEPQGERPEAAILVGQSLRDRLATLEATEPAFRDARQARETIDLVFEGVLPAYRRFHADLLEHQSPGAVERPFSVMAATQAVLAAGGPGTPDVVDDAINRLNDYVGWRPVAVLENGRLSEPYPHERVRPVPLFVAGAGAAHGRYRDLVAGAIEILAAAPDQLVQQADVAAEQRTHDAGDLRVQQHALDEPVFEHDDARLVRAADALDVGHRHAGWHPRWVGWQAPFEIVDGALIDFWRHDAFQQQMSVAAESDDL